MATVQLKNIRKVYPSVTDEGVVAVQDFNLDIADKEFSVLVGPSGYGKSTTLRMVAGLEDITGGRNLIMIVPFNGDKEIYSMGDVVHFKFRGSVAHVFNRETGHNLEYSEDDLK